MLKIAVLHNTESGTNKRKGFKKVRQLLSEYSDIKQIEVNSLSGISQSLSVIMQMRVGLILINGGDGTLQAVLTLLHLNYAEADMPLIAVLPAGTTNMTAGDVGMRGSRGRAVQSLLKGICANKLDTMCIKRPVLRVQYEPEGQPLYGMFFGAAGIYTGIKYCRKRIHSIGLRGELGPGLAMVTVIGSFVFGKNRILQPCSMGMQVDGGELREQELMLVYATTLQRLFLGIRPFLKTESAPIHFTAIQSAPKHMLRILPSFLRGRSHRLFTPDNGYESYNVERLEFGLDGGFTLDGELYNADRTSRTVTVDYGGEVTFVRPT